MSTKEIGSKVIATNGRFSIVKDVYRVTARRGLRTDWMVETKGQRGVMAFDTLREASEWFDAVVKEDADKAVDVQTAGAMLANVS